jgi:hypothetical protein
MRLSLPSLAAGSLLLLSSLAPTAFALTRTWDGGGADSLWSTAGNWTGDAVPGAGDIAVFDSTSAKNAQMPTAVTVNSLRIGEGYGGTVTQSGGILLTIGTGSFVVGGGTFRGGTGATVVNGSFTQTGGTFTAPASRLQVLRDFTRTGGTYSANHGMVLLTPTNSRTFTPGGATFGNVDINDGLVGYWKLDDLSGTVATDSSGYGNHGTLQGFGDDGDSTYWKTTAPSTVTFPDAGSLRCTCLAPSGEYGSR